MRPRREPCAPADHPIVAGRFDRGVNYRTQRPAGSADWLLIYTVRGGGRYEDEHSRWSSRAGDVTLYPPGVPQAYATDPTTKRWVLLWAHFRPATHWRRCLDWPTRLGRLRHVHLRRRGDRHAVQRHLADALGYERSARGHATELALAALYSALLLIHDAQNMDRPAGHPHDPIHDVLDVMHETSAEPWSVDTLAALSPWSASRFAHRFVDAVGQPPMRYLEGVRLRRAADLLRRTALPVGQVAAEVGFDDPLYFSRRFRASTGTSPTEFRRKPQARGRRAR